MRILCPNYGDTLLKVAFGRKHLSSAMHRFTTHGKVKVRSVVTH
jgi:hypothetical protein